MNKPNRQIKNSKPPAKTRSYEPIKTWWLRRHQRLPPLSFQMIEQILLDETIQIGLACRRSVLQGVEFGYKANGQWQIGVLCQDEAVAAWVMRQLLTLWRIGLEHITQSQTYGWAAMEVIWQRKEEYNNLWEIVGIEERHPTDTRLLINDETGRPCGTRFFRVKGADEGYIDLHFPQSFFHAYKPNPGEWYGQTVLWGAYRAWSDKHLDGGAIDVRRLFMHKDAYGGADLQYPEGTTNIGTLENPNEVPNRELAREIVEQIEAGGVTTTPATYDEAGHKMWELTRATVPANPAHILSYPGDLDGEMLRGMGVPDGVLKADDSGSWQGRLIPMQILYATLDPWVTTILRDIREQLLEPAIINNWGKVIDFEVQHRPLAEQALEQQRNPGGGGGGMDPTQGDPSGGMDPSMMQGDPSMGMDPSAMQGDPSMGQQGPQMMSLAGRIGLGLDEPTRWLEAARMAIDQQQDDQVKKKAKIIASILFDLFGDEAESHFDEVFGSAVRMAAWRSIDHPRGSDGKFIAKNSPEAVHSAKTAIREALKGKRTPSSLKTVTEHLSILTTKQLRSLQKEHGIRASGVKQTLIDKIASRLHGAIVQSDEEADPNRENGTPKHVNSQDTYTVPVDSLHVDPERFQYKVKNIDSQGVTEELKSVGVWNPEMAGVLLVWRDPDSGKDYVVNGHHRHHLAKRLGAKLLNVRYIKADSAREARAKGALANIAEGRGTSVDAAKYLRDSGHDLDHFATAGISLKGRIADEAGILKNLADRPFDAVTRGRLDEAKAIAVARHIKSHELQNQLFHKLDKDDDRGKEWSNREIEQMAKKLANSGQYVDRGTDLFGDYEETRSTFDQEVEIEAFVAKSLAQTANDFRAVANKRRADRVSDAGNVLAVDENAIRADRAEKDSNDFAREQHLRGKVADTIKFFAGKLAQAKTKKAKETIKIDALQAVSDALHNTPTMMSAMRAPSGFTHDHPFVVAGKSYIGGQFIPSEVVAQATPEQKKAIEAAHNADHETPIERGKGSQHEKYYQQVLTGRNLKLKNDHAVRITYDRSTGFKVQHKGPGNIRTEFPHRFKSVHEAADFATEQLMRRGTILPKAKAAQPSTETAAKQAPPPKPKQPWEMTAKEWADKTQTKPVDLARTAFQGGIVEPFTNVFRRNFGRSQEDSDSLLQKSLDWINGYFKANKSNTLESFSEKDAFKQGYADFLKSVYELSDGYSARRQAEILIPYLQTAIQDAPPDLAEEHKAFVLKAMLDGENVPDDVLKDYPEYQVIKDKRNEADIKPPKEKRPPFRYKGFEFWNNGLKAKFRGNLEALKTLQELKEQNREPTPEDLEKMSKWVGWGQFPAVLNDYAERHKLPQDIQDDTFKWRDERNELRKYLGEAEFKSAQRSTRNAHYTHPEVVDAQWKMAERLGFSGGRMLEPAFGSGSYVGFMPESLIGKTDVTAVELDLKSAEIAQALYPNVRVVQNAYQDTALPANHYDLFTTNAPFDGQLFIKDKETGIRCNLHNYYLLRSTRDTKPGGLAILMTSTGTLDRPDPEVMAQVDKNMEFVSAIRFPGDTHKDNAGTSVVTDLILLRRKNPLIPETTEETPSEAEPKQPGFSGTTIDSLGRLYYWRDGKRVPKPNLSETSSVSIDSDEPLKISKYFADNPEQMLGKLDRTGTMYRKGMMNVSRQENYQDALRAAIERLPQNIVQTASDEQLASHGTRASERREATGTNYFEGQLVIQDGKLWRYEQGGLTAMGGGDKSARLFGLTRIRDAGKALLSGSIEQQEELRAKLNAEYDSFVSEFGPINNDKNRAALKYEIDAPFLKSLEKWDPKNKTASKRDIFSKDTIRKESSKTASTIGEAVGVSLHEYGKIDVARIASLLGKDAETVVDEIEQSGLAYLPPGSSEFESADQYLSGHVKEKLRIAREAANSDPRYLAHVAALEKNQPDDIAKEDITVNFGAGWIPPSTIADYLAEKTGYDQSNIHVLHSSAVAKWDVTLNGRADNLATAMEFQNYYSVGDISAMDMIKAALNDSNVSVYTEAADGKRALDVDATAEAKVKLQEIRDDFAEWIFGTEEREKKYTRLYNDTENDIKERTFDGSHQAFPGMVDFEADRMYQIQRNAVWRIVTTGRALLAHEVGTGKTNTMVASAMELRRLGLAKKPVIACLKANVEQLAKEAQELYPNAKILAPTKWGKEHRREVLNQIATSDWDLIIISHDNLEGLAIKGETKEKLIREEMRTAEAALIEARRIQDESEGGKKSRFGNRIVKQIEGQLANLEERMKEALGSIGRDDIYFEDLGIDQLFVDEAHQFKSLPVYTSKNIKGIPTNVSNRALDMLFKTRYLLDKHNNRGVVFATGTPISNTMAELYTMQRFIQPKEMQRKNLEHFDAWAKNYGQTTFGYETKLTGERKQTERFAKFINVPELRTLTSEFMDVQFADNVVNSKGEKAIKRPKKQEIANVSEENDAVRNFMAEINDRALSLKDNPDNGDNWFSILHDMRMGSLDLRLVDMDAEDHPDSKVNKCVKNLLQIAAENPGKTQCVFSELGVHEGDDGRISLFDDIINKLVANGIPRDEIANFSDAKMKDDVRDTTQEKMKQGAIRFGFGSTKTLGTGVNVQTNLKAIHHLDCPYVPAAQEQRNGRGYRQGNNLYKEGGSLGIHRYVQQGSGDEMLWGIIARKTNFINGFMRGSGNREMEDLSIEELSPEEMQALATGDERVLKQMQLENQLNQLNRGSQRHNAEMQRARNTIETAPTRKQSYLDAIEKLTDSISRAHPDFSIDIGNMGKSQDISRKDAEAELQKMVDSKINDRNLSYSSSKIAVGKYRGFNLVMKRNYYSSDKPYEFALENPVNGESYGFSGTTKYPSLQSADYAIRAWKNQLESLNRVYLTVDEEVSRAKTMLSKPYRYASELENTKKELESLAEKIRADRERVMAATKSKVDESIKRGE